MKNRYLLGVMIAVMVVLALFGAWQMVEGAQNLYGDWVFLRQQRVLYIQQQQRQQQQTPKPQPKPAEPVTPAE